MYAIGSCMLCLQSQVNVDLEVYFEALPTHLNDRIFPEPSWTRFQEAKEVFPTYFYTENVHLAMMLMCCLLIQTSGFYKATDLFFANLFIVLLPDIVEGNELL